MSAPLFLNQSFVILDINSIAKIIWNYSRYYRRYFVAVFIFAVLFSFQHFYPPTETILKPVEEVSLVITIKTTFKNHRTRVTQIIDTWYQFIPKDIYFVTDAFDPLINQTIQGNLVNTSCTPFHDIPSLNCKLDAELQILVSRNATWSCRFDDDNYVNVPQLLKVLSTFDPHKPYYLGRSWAPVPFVRNGELFWYGTGGAGVCLSHAALELARSKIVNHDFISYHKKYDGMYDDVALGYFFSVTLKVNFIEMPNFYSHINDMKIIPIHELKNIPVLAQKEEEKNFVSLPYFYNPRDDPFKFHTLHCFLYPKRCTTQLTRLPVEIFDVNKLK